ncbi:MAG TPA: deoxyribonuclease IV [Blastocatellia bacterium]|nr:deoxyribonuclease IV [Blastocatellia bacterium]
MNNTSAPRIGVHTSIAGGLPNAVESAVAKGCDAFQIFARNPRGWLERPLSQEEVIKFRMTRERAALWPVAIHSVYLINLAAQDPVIQARSREAFRQEIERAIRLGADYLVVHPGNPKTAPAEAGIQTAVESIREAARGLKLNGEMTILIENTAGQGSSIGCNFEQVADIVAALDDLPVGVCLDTAHTFASGYDISTEAGLRATVRAIRRSFGFDRLKLVHCNDSKAPLGSRVDRHQHIGLGHIGAEAFGRILHNLKFRSVPFILETPVDSERDDIWNINRLRELSSI